MQYRLRVKHPPLFTRHARCFVSFRSFVNVILTQIFNSCSITKRMFLVFVTGIMNNCTRVFSVRLVESMHKVVVDIVVSTNWLANDSFTLAFIIKWAPPTTIVYDLNHYNSYNHPIQNNCAFLNKVNSINDKISKRLIVNLHTGTHIYLKCTCMENVWLTFLLE